MDFWLIGKSQKVPFKRPKNRFTFYIYHLEGGPPLGTISMDQAVNSKIFDNKIIMDRVFLG